MLLHIKPEVRDKTLDDISKFYKKHLSQEKKEIWT